MELERFVEKAGKIAEELDSQGADAVILSGSAARGKENPNDLDLLVFGEVETDGETLSEKYDVPIELFVVEEEHVDSLLESYRNDKVGLGWDLSTMAIDASGRSAGWPLIPFLSEEEFEDFFGKYLGYHEGHPYLTKEYVILQGQEYIDGKRERFLEED